MTPPSMPRDFRCLHCGAIVNTDHASSAVNHRNHCPLCLWSRHLDLTEAGDRLSACKAPMVPLGLCLKPGRNKYRPGGGELMLVHSCMDCGRLSLNRIAADDDVHALLDAFTASLYLPADTRELLFVAGICLLGQESDALLRRMLLGASAVILI